MARVTWPWRRPGGPGGLAYLVRTGQVFDIAERSRNLLPFAIAASSEPAAIPAYLAVDTPDLRARLERLPAGKEIPVICDARLVVEHYSR
jgi:ribosomal protein S4